tara:strand:+ start:87 stop:353 length:267 start_codon:yes stop_codon:yes gene_type:complete
MAKLTVRDVAEQESVSERTILNWVDRGILTPAYRVGKVIRFTEEGVRKDLGAHTPSKKLPDGTIKSYAFRELPDGTFVSNEPEMEVSK